MYVEVAVRVFVFTSAELVSPRTSISSRRASLDAAYNIHTSRGMIVLTGHAPYTWITRVHYGGIHP